MEHEKENNKQTGGDKMQKNIACCTKRNVVISFIIGTLAGLAFSGLLTGKEYGLSSYVGENKASVLQGARESRGDLWVTTHKKHFIGASDSQELKVYVNTNGASVGVFSFDVDFDEQRVSIDTQTGQGGVTQGVDAEQFILATNPADISSGHMRISGMCIQNCLTGNKKHLLSVHVRTKNKAKLTNTLPWFTLTELTDEYGNAIPFETNTDTYTIKTAQ